jgi:hypothetical protein
MSSHIPHSHTLNAVSPVLDTNNSDFEIFDDLDTATEGEIDIGLDSFRPWEEDLYGHDESIKRDGDIDIGLDSLRPWEEEVQNSDESIGYSALLDVHKNTETEIDFGSAKNNDSPYASEYEEEFDEEAEPDPIVDLSVDEPSRSQSIDISFSSLSLNSPEPSTSDFVPSHLSSPVCSPLSIKSQSNSQLSDFSFQTLLGKGSFGTVSLVRRIADIGLTCSPTTKTCC